MTNITADQIEEKLGLTDDRLYEDIGVVAGRGAIVGDPKNKGRDLFDRLKKDLQDAVCRRSSVRILYEKGADHVFLVAAIADAAISVIVKTGLPLPPVSLAVLFFRSGIGQLCSTHWKA